MKAVFKCDYCDFMGIEEEVKQHESECYHNYDLKSCTTCAYKKSYPSKETLGLNFKCSCGLELPEGKMMINCKKHKREEDTDILNDLFGGLLGRF